MLQNIKLYKVEFLVVTMDEKRGNHISCNFPKSLKGESFSISTYFTK